jgi:hypothetical protein
MNAINLDNTAQSIHNETVHTNSPKYVQVSTKAVIDRLAAAGWVPVRVATRRTNSPYARHLVEFRNPEFCKDAEYEPRIILTNSHDGTSSFQLKLGIFRLVCSNGLVLGRTTYSTHRIRHVGFCISKVSAALAQLERDTASIQKIVGALSGQDLTPTQAAEFAYKAAALRFGDKVPVSYASILKARRPEDAGLSLWRVFNVIQENLIKGGLTYQSINEATGRVRNQSTRRVSAIEANLKLNEQLFDLALTFTNGAK